MWLTEKRISPLQLIIIVSSIYYLIFNETNIIPEYTGYVKMLIYTGLLVVTACAGISMVNVKEIATKIKDIMQDRNKTAEQKLNDMMGVALPLLSNIGDLWDVVTKEQFDKAKNAPSAPEEAKA